MSTTPFHSRLSATTATAAANPETETEEQRIARLAALKPMDYDRLRKEEAKALGIQVKTLDDMVKAARTGDRAAENTLFVEHEPSDDPVDPAALFDEVSAVIRQFIVLDVEQADAAALWLAHTHLVDVADVSPLAIINAPERACAKTLFQTLLGRMCFRALPASNASLSALFRAIESWRPTILIDEADTFFRDNTELHGMVNAGYQRGGCVLRSEPIGDSFEPRTFAVYSPKSIAGIALERHLPDATMSRGIVFNMRRKLPHEHVQRLRHADETVFVRLGSQLARFAADHSQQVRLARPHLPDELSDRAQDNWEPLLAIAGCAGPIWVKRATDAALKMSAASEAMTSTGNDLLADIKEVFDGMSATKISTVDLLVALTSDEEKSWATYNRGKPITPRQLAKQLEVYGIRPKTVRQGSKTPKGYEVGDFSDAFDRYLKPPPDDPAPSAGDPAASETPPHGVVPDLSLPGRGGVADTSATSPADAPDAPY